VWAAGFAVITSLRCRDWFRIRAALRAGTRVELPLAVPALVSPGAREPGIVGFLRPVLILPVRLLEHLTSPQLDAVLAHELWHVRRCDNFFAAIHMAVEAIFWFHPMVWWIGSHMLEERELACDEGVLRMGLEPTDYAEAILQVCRLCTESQLPCVSGVTGANVKKRLRAILTGNIAPELTFGKKMLLTAIGLLTLVAPVSIGVLHTPQVQAQSPRAAAPPAAGSPDCGSAARSSGRSARCRPAAVRSGVSQGNLRPARLDQSPDDRSTAIRGNGYFAAPDGVGLPGGSCSRFMRLPNVHRTKARSGKCFRLCWRTASG
jgi:hypothetical protein